MSKNIYPLEIVQTYDPLVRVFNKRQYDVLKGANVVSYQQFPATNINNSVVSVTCNPTSEKHVVNRKAYVRMSFVMTITGDAGIGNLMLGTGSTATDLGFQSGPAQYPISQVLTTIQASINNDNISVNLNSYWNALLRYRNPHSTRNFDYSMTPSQLDQMWDYNLFGALGTNRNVFGRYAENAYENTRNSFSGIVVLQNTRFQAQVRLVATENIWMSPFYFGPCDNSGFIGVKNMSFQFTLGDLRRIWRRNPSLATNPAYDTMVVNLESATMLFNYLTPSITEPIPNQISWPYFEMLPLKNTSVGGPMAVNETRQLTSDAIQVKSIPKRIYIWVDRVINTSDLSSVIDYPDFFFSIQNINIQWDNMSGVLSSASQEDLYQISKRNGCNMSFSEWTSWIGSVLCLSFPENIGCSSIQAPGLVDNKQFQCKVLVTNQTNYDNLTPQLNLLFVSEGTWSIVNGSALHQVGVFTERDVIDSKSAPSVPYNYVKDIYGGNLLSSLVKVGKDLAPCIAKAISGSGKKSKRRAGVLVGAGLQEDNEEQEEYPEYGYGGRMMSAKELKRRLREE